jgi:hypothetical protein
MDPIRVHSRECLSALAVIFLVVLAAYFPVVIGAESFYHMDRYFLHAPFWHAAANAITQGDFPFWAHGIRAGYPLFANGEASLLYPFTYAFAPFFPSHRALDLFTIFHLIRPEEDPVDGSRDRAWILDRPTTGARVVVARGCGVRRAPHHAGVA